MYRMTVKDEGAALAGKWVVPGQTETSRWAMSHAQGDGALRGVIQGTVSPCFASVAVGVDAMSASNTSQCVAVGANALYQASGGVGNVAVGFNALMGPLNSASFNVGIGDNCGAMLTTGQQNVFVGRCSGWWGGGNSNNGTTTASKQTCIGVYSGQGSSTPADNITCIGNSTSATTAGGVAIGIDSTGVGAASTAADQAVIGTGLTSLKVGNPGQGSGAWKLGKVVTGTVSLDTTKYIEVMIDGVVKKVLVAP